MSSSLPEAARRSRWRARARVATYLFAVTTIATVATGQRARARTGALNLALGRELAPLAESAGDAGARVSLNGQIAAVASAIVRERKSALLARFEERCLANPGLPGSAWRDLAATRAPASQVSALRRLGTIRREGDHDGVVACFERGADTAASLAALARAFASGADLAALGLVRFAYVRERGDRSHVTMVWTEGSFRLDKLAPPPGVEAEGADFDDLPRPPSSVRRLSIRVEATGFGVNLYEADRVDASTLDGFDEAMRARGWIALAPTDVRSHARAYLRSGSIALLDAQPAGAATGRTMVALSVLGAGRDALAPSAPMP